MIRTILRVAALGWALPAAAQALAVETGQQIDLTVSGSDVRIVGIARATAEPWELQSGGEFDSGQYDDAKGANFKPMGDDGPPVPVPATGRIRVRLTATAKGNALLTIANGYDQALVYRARITQGKASAQTDVCMVLPAKHGVEHWPYRIDKIEMSDMHLVPWTPGDWVVCE